MIVNTRLGSYSLFKDDSFFLSHVFIDEKRGEIKSFFKDVFNDSSNQAQVLRYFLEDLKLKVFFWHDKYGFKNVFSIDETDDQKISSSSSILGYVNDFKINFKLVDQSNFLAVGFNKAPAEIKTKKEELDQHIFLIKKNINELNLSEIKAYFSDKNLLDSSTDKVSLLSTITYKNFIIRDSDQVICSFEKNIKDFTPIFSIFSSTTKKYCPILRGSKMIFLAFIPIKIEKNKIIFMNFDEEKIVKEFGIANEMFSIVLDFLYNTDKDVDTFRENIDLFYEIKDNLEIVKKGQDLRMKLDFFGKNEGIPFNYFLTDKYKEKILKYFDLFLKKNKEFFQETFESLLKKEISEQILNEAINFDKLVLKLIVNASKKINEMFFQINPPLTNIYNKISQDIMSENFAKALVLNPVMSLGVSEFLLNNSQAFSYNDSLKNAVGSLLGIKAFSPVESSKLAQKYEEEAKKFIRESLQLSEI